MKDKLSSVSILSFVVLGMLGVRLLTLPREIAQHAGNDSWASVLLAGLLYFITGYSFYWLSINYHGQNISEIIETILGKFIGKFLQVAIAAYTLLSVGLSVRAFSESIKVFLLDQTPQLWIIAFMLLACLFCVNKDITTISIVLDILLPGILFFMVFQIALSISNIDVENLLPVFHQGPVPVLRGFVEIIQPLLGVGIVGYVMPYFEKPKTTKKWIFIGVSIVIAIYLIVVTMCILVFGSVETNQLIYPTLILTKSIQFQVQIFERAESLFMTAWIPATFATAVIYYYASCINTKVLFKTKKYTLITFLQIPLLFGIALFPRNVVLVYEYLDLTNYLAIGLCIIVLVLPLISKLKRKRNGKSI